MPELPSVLNTTIYEAHPARADRDSKQKPDEQIYNSSQSRGQAAQTTESAGAPKSCQGKQSDECGCIS